MQFARQIITLEYVHVNLAQLAILCLAVHKFSIVVLIISVHRARNVTMEYAQQFVQARVTVSAINCALRRFANQLATATQPALTSNFAKIIFVFKSRNA